jgi:hypothetical protein
MTSFERNDFEASSSADLSHQEKLQQAQQKLLAKMLEQDMDEDDPEVQQQMQQQLSPENLKTLPEIQNLQITSLSSSPIQ